MKIGCLNAGSTSVKYGVFEVIDDEPFYQSDGWFPLGQSRDAQLAPLLDESVDVVVHRVVHGGERLNGPVAITKEVRNEIEQLTPLAPLHQPAAVHLIDLVSDELPDCDQFACFDTDFFRTLPPQGHTLPVPKAFRDAGVRRYGFHGLAYESVLFARPSLAQGRTVLCHVGGGVSVTALNNGQPIATSMGLTPNGGVPMATRSGDLDPGVTQFIAETLNLSAAEVTERLAREGGLLGLSESSGDIRDLLAKRDRDRRAELALSIYTNAIAEQIAAYVVRLGGIDHLSFSGGVAENNSDICQEIRDRLDAVSLLDAAQTACVVTPCNEEHAMARCVAAHFAEQRSYATTPEGINS